mmetsp:Transcript_59735/g.129407  ORF Transcript_59735/g.129407 Transcript_59735/m.129407 type:complete len:225 (+) Transcript_59735:250-924(+)|eukprot:CAMPEP_0170620710 /NCGR_PEP_ID=MMETSP0224-20130122/28202_1 /TAXON_ID=285029 /ORGANISM="Togula jolla, Strain CCCM 725" /LENGTH=224 /DNA_ID=CAMNT_0010946899 /DNA_START=250 /DNA_END=924 /DNA_ORIENTATION=-
MEGPELRRLITRNWQCHELVIHIVKLALRETFNPKMLRQITKHRHGTYLAPVLAVPHDVLKVGDMGRDSHPGWILWKAISHTDHHMAEHRRDALEVGCGDIARPLVCLHQHMCPKRQALLQLFLRQIAHPVRVAGLASLPEEQANRIEDPGGRCAAHVPAGSNHQARLSGVAKAALCVPARLLNCIQVAPFTLRVVAVLSAIEWSRTHGICAHGAIQESVTGDL